MHRFKTFFKNWCNPVLGSIPRLPQIFLTIRFLKHYFIRQLRILNYTVKKIIHLSFIQKSNVVWGGEGGNIVKFGRNLNLFFPS